MVDLHAITLPHEPKALLEATRQSAATYIACGIDPERANIFVQSHVSAHAELAWLLSCGTPIGWLRKMVQFKEKSQARVRLLTAEFYLVFDRHGCASVWCMYDS